MDAKRMISLTVVNEVWPSSDLNIKKILITILSLNFCIVR